LSPTNSMLSFPSAVRFTSNDSSSSETGSHQGPISRPGSPLMSSSWSWLPSIGSVLERRINQRDFSGTGSSRQYLQAKFSKAPPHKFLLFRGACASLPGLAHTNSGCYSSLYHGPERGSAFSSFIHSVNPPPSRYRHVQVSTVG
jgi:hypothetical protein